MSSSAVNGVDRPSSPPPPPPESLHPPAPPDDSLVPPPPEDVPPPPPDSLTNGMNGTEHQPPKKKKGWDAKPARKPLSMEEVLRKKREADEAASKVRKTLAPWVDKYSCSLL